MKKVYTLLTALLIAGIAIAQVAPYKTYKKLKPGKQAINEQIATTHENTQKDVQVTFFSEDFEAGDLSAWSNLDEDGDASIWEANTTWGGANASTGCAVSASWTSTAGALTADNWLISSAIDLSTATGNVTLGWWAANQDVAWPDHYEVYVSTTGSTPADFTTMLYSGEPSNTDAAVFEEHTADLSSYAGSTIYIAFRHYDTNAFYIKIDDIEVFENTLTDAAIVDITAPNNDGGCALGASETVTVSILNNSGSAISNFDVSYQIDGGTVVTETVSASINPSETYDYSFTQTADFSTLAYYDVTATVALSGDADATNDSYTEQITSADAYITVAGYTPANGGQSWTITNSTGTVIASHGAYQWNINVSDDVCVLDNDCYTFAFTAGENGGMGDDGYLEISYNGTPVGGTTTAGQQTADFTVDFIGNGCADIEDVGVSAISVGSATCALSATETIIATITNYGSVDASNFDISYQVDGGTVVTETVTGTVPQGGTLDYSFTQTADLSTAGTYSINAYTALGTDVNTANDALTETVTSADATVTVTITFDDYADETSWDLVNTLTSETVASGSGYDGSVPTITEDICVSSDQCYTFTIYDAYGDGICCDYGSGSYEVLYNGTSLATGGDFGSEEATMGIGTGCPTNDVALQSINTPLYANPGSIDITGTIYNLGSDPVTSYDVVYNIDGGTNSTTYTVTGVNIATAETGTFTHDVPYNFTTDGTYTINVEITAVNGGADENTANNTGSKDININSNMVPRTVLFEEFSTEQCPNCPPVATYLHDYMSTNPNMIMMVHHSAYYTDDFTIPENEDMLVMFEGLSGTFAPAGMADRFFFDDVNITGTYDATTYYAAPAFWCGDPYGGNAIDERVNTPAFVTVEINGTYDQGTNALNATVHGNFVGALSGTVGTSLWITEDDIESTNQAGFTGTWTHHDVIRDAISDMWGDEITTGTSTGDDYTKDYTFTVDPTWVYDNLYLVAMVNQIDASDVNNRFVHNSIRIKLSDLLPLSANKTNIESNVSIYPNPTDGQLYISNAENSTIYVFNSLGEVITIVENANQFNKIDLSNESKGTYIVKVVTENDVVAKKITLVK